MASREKPKTRDVSLTIEVRIVSSEIGRVKRLLILWIEDKSLSLVFKSDIYELASR